MGRVVIELTDRCNLACVHCHDGRHGGNNDLPLEILQMILADAAKEGFDKLSFTGGDPTLHPRFRGILQRCAGSGYRFGLVTNGWNFTTVQQDLLEHREHLESITFSLDGATAATHDPIRGRHSYRRVLQAMSVCLALDLPFNINTVVSRRNQSELGDLVRLAVQIGSRGIRFGHLLPTPGGTRLELDLSPDQRKLVEQRIHELSRSAPIPVGIAPGYHTSDPFPCGPLRMQEINVDCRGNLTKCCHLSSQGSHAGNRDIVANLRELSFPEACRRLRDDNAAYRTSKEERISRGDLQDAELFPCWYCSLYYEKLDWLKDVPNHSWARLIRRLHPSQERRR